MGKGENIIGKIYENKRGEKYKVVELAEKNSIGGRFRIIFLETGYEAIHFRSNIIKGNPIDKSKKDANMKYKIGSIIINKNGVKALIEDVEFIPRKNDPTKYRSRLKIRFIESGYVSYSSPDNFIRCKTKDYLSPSVSGVGKLGYVEHLDGKLRDMKEYQIWEGMLFRCYGSDHETREVSYEDAEVCERWHRFDYFLEDIVHVEGYELWQQYHKEHPDEKNIYEFDKDTKVIGNKTYSPETCRFIHKKINAGFTSWAKENTKKDLINKLNQQGEDLHAI